MTETAFPPMQAAMEATLAAQGQAIASMWETTRAAMALLHEASLRQATLAQGLMEAANVAMREAPDPHQAATRLAVLGWQGTQDFGRNFGTLTEQMCGMLAAACARAAKGQ